MQIIKRAIKEFEEEKKTHSYLIITTKLNIYFLNLVWVERAKFVNKYILAIYYSEFCFLKKKNVMKYNNFIFKHKFKPTKTHKLMFVGL